MRSGSVVLLHVRPSDQPHAPLFVWTRDGVVVDACTIDTDRSDSAETVVIVVSNIDAALEGTR